MEGITDMGKNITHKIYHTKYHKYQPIAGRKLYIERNHKKLGFQIDNMEKIKPVKKWLMQIIKLE